MCQTVVKLRKGNSESCKLHNKLALGHISQNLVVVILFTS